jgi:hypothetical protein
MERMDMHTDNADRTKNGIFSIINVKKTDGAVEAELPTF